MKHLKLFTLFFLLVSCSDAKRENIEAMYTLNTQSMIELSQQYYLRYQESGFMDEGKNKYIRIKSSILHQNILNFYALSNQFISDTTTKKISINANGFFTITPIYIQPLFQEYQNSYSFNLCSPRLVLWTRLILTKRAIG